MISALLVITTMVTRERPLSELKRCFTRFPQVLINQRVSRKEDLSSVATVVSAIEAAERELGREGRVLVRYSGTEPLARVMIEGRDADVINRHAQQIASAIADALG